MRKGMLLLVLLILAVGVTHAAPVSDLTALAAYFPQETVAFAALRTDDGLIQELDGLLARVVAKLPPDAVPPAVTLAALLDLSAMQITGQDFAGGIRAWLGSTAAIGTPDIQSFQSTSPAVLIALSSTDREAATTFWRTLLNRSGATMEQSVSDDYTLLTNDDGDMGVMIANDVVLIGLQIADLDAILTDATASSLADNAKFTGTLALLPADDYHLAVYLDTQAIAAFYTMTITGSASGFMGLYNLVSASAMGITLRDGDTLLVDMAVKAGDVGLLSQFGELSGLAFPQIGVIDPAFARFIPADVTFTLHSTNLKALAEFELGLVSVLLATNSIEESPQAGMEQSRDALYAQFKAMTGLDLETDVLGWMTGNYALFGRLDGEAMLSVIEMSMQWILVGDAQIVFEQVPFGGGLVIEATDPARAQAFAAALGNLLVQTPSPMTITQEQIGGVAVTVMAQSIGDEFVQPLEWVIGATGEVFFIATRPDAEILLSGTGGLDTSAAYQTALIYTLPGATTLWYASPDAVDSLALFGFGLLAPARGEIFSPTGATLTPEEVAARDEARQRQNEEQQRTIATLRGLASLFQGGTLSTAFTAQGDALARFVIQLGE